MSFTTIPNSGIMHDDDLDGMRRDAVMAHHATPLPDAVLRYLRALESDYLDRLHEQHKQSAREIGWVSPPEPAP